MRKTKKYTTKLGEGEVHLYYPGESIRSETVLMRERQHCTPQNVRDEKSSIWIIFTVYPNTKTFFTVYLKMKTFFTVWCTFTSNILQAFFETFLPQRSKLSTRSSAQTVSHQELRSLSFSQVCTPVQQPILLPYHVICRPNCSLEVLEPNN